MSASLTVNRNYAFWKQALDFLVSHTDRVIVSMRADEQGEVTSVVLMFVNTAKRIMVHVYLDLSFFDAVQISHAFQILVQISDLYQNQLSFNDTGFVGDYVNFDWHPHTEENMIPIEELLTLYPTLPPIIVSALSKVTSTVYYKNSPEIPLVICKQFPNQGAALKIFIGGL